MFTGSIVALVTPMYENGDIDWDAFDKLIEWHLQEGTSGLVVLGTTGESTTVTAQEREMLVKRAVEVVSGRAPVIIGTGTNSTAATIANTQQALDLGADAALIVTPYYNKPPQSGLIAHFSAIANAVPIPIILYNVPGRTACDLLPETAAELAKVSNIVAVKEATGDLSRMAEYMRLDTGLDLLSGDDNTAADFILAGGKGVVSVAANMAPRMMQQLSDEARAGHAEAVQAIQEQLAPLFHELAVQSNPIPVKWGVAKMGLIPQGIRLPLVSLESRYQSELVAVMNSIGLVD